MTDTLNKTHQSCTVSDTPETKWFFSRANVDNWNDQIDFCERLERERNEAIRSCHIWQTGNSALVRDRDEAIWDCNQRINKVSAEREDWKTIAVEYEKEIEEWKVEVERWRSLAQGWREEAVNAIKDTRG